MENEIKLMIVDDQKLFRIGLTTLLNEYKTIKVIAEAENGADALNILKLCTPDVIFMDIDMPVMNGMEATIQIKKLYPNVKILVLSMHDEPFFSYEFMKNGANGYLVKNIDVDILLSAIETVYKGGLFLDESTAKALGITTDITRPIEPILQERALNKDELDLLKAICTGRSNKEISASLDIPLGTLKYKKAILKEKTSCNSDVDLVFYAFRHGYVTYNDNRFA